MGEAGALPSESTRLWIDPGPDRDRRQCTSSNAGCSPARAAKTGAARALSALAASTGNRSGLPGICLSAANEHHETGRPLMETALLALSVIAALAALAAVLLPSETRREITKGRRDARRQVLQEQLAAWR